MHTHLFDKKLRSSLSAESFLIFLLFSLLHFYCNQVLYFYCRYIYQENIQIMKTQCCIIVVSIAKLKVVLQMCLQTISSSVLSCDGHLKPVCKFNLGSLYVIMKIVITTLIRLQVCANCWYESYLRAFECIEYIL